MAALAQHPAHLTDRIHDMISAATPGQRRNRPARTIGLWLTVTALAGCTATPDTDRRPCSEPDPAAAGVDRCNPDAVITHVVTAVFTHQRGAPAPDTGLRSARALLSATSPHRGVTAGSLDPAATVNWQRWHANATTVTATATVTADDHPPDTQTRRARVLAVTQTSSDHTPRRRLTVYATATRDQPGHAWLVHTIDLH